MQARYRSSTIFTLFVLCLFGLAIVISACTQAEAVVEPPIEATPGLDVPSGVMAARDAVLVFLRSDANCCVPAEGVQWQADPGKAPAGFSVYRFHAANTLITVAYPQEAEEMRYHVGFTNEDIGYCWQASVNAQGRVVDTGTAAALMPELAEAAANSCQDAGYEYSIEEQPDGTSCGVCTFPDGSHCKAWLFYQDECAPGETP